MVLCCKIEFVYDSSGLCGFKYNSEEYLYQKNIQGDIIAILNLDGEVIAEYRYDAWGNCKYDLASGIATANPFRYRGYYYDRETGLYFLQTRYYDPEVGRFISQDDVTYLDPEHINGLNLYAYCCNNPVMMTDPDGTLPKWLKWLLGGLAFVAAVVLTVVTGGSLTPVLVGMGASILGEGLIEGTITALNGGSFLEGFSEGAANGAMFGGFSALGGSLIRTIKLFRNGVVIGESMTRVNAAASRIGAVTYKAPGKTLLNVFGGKNAGKIMLNQNQRWINRMKRWGIRITDIGVNTDKFFLSEFYAMERASTRGYKYLTSMLWPATKLFK